MSLSSDLVSAFAKITNDKPAKNTEGSTAYGRYVLQNDKAYVQIDGSDVLTPVTTTTEARNGDRVTIMIKNHRAVVTGNLTDPSVSGESLDEFKIEVGTNLSGENLISRINMTPGNILIEASHINLKGAVTADAIAVGALEVGKNVTMGPNAVVSWSNLPYNVASYGDIPTNAEITTITQNAVKTEDIIIGGWIWDSFDVGKQRILGVNWNDNLQVGTVSNAHYKRVNIYAPEDINLVHGGGQTADVYGLRVRSNGSVAIKSLATGGSNTGADKASYRIMTVGSDGDIYATATTLKDLTEGSLKVTAVFG